MFDRRTIDALKAQADLARVVARFVQLRPAGQAFRGPCPFHDDTTPSLHVDPVRARWRCYGCHSGGDVLDFLQRIEACTFTEAVERLAGYVGTTLPAEVPAGPKTIASSGTTPDGPDAAGSLPLPARSGPLEAVPARIRDALTFAHVFFQQQLQTYRPARASLETRGLSTATARAFGLGYAPRQADRLLLLATRAGFSTETLRRAGLVQEARTIRPSPGRPLRDTFRGRLMIPLHDETGALRGFTGRLLEPAEAAPAFHRPDRPRYHTSPHTAFFDGRLLFGLFEAHRWGWTQGAQRLIVTEGYLDVLALTEHHLSPACALGTPAVSLRQARRLEQFVLTYQIPRVVLLLDGDAGGRTGTRQVLEGLQAQAGLAERVHAVAMPEGLDPTSFLNRHGADPLRAML